MAPDGSERLTNRQSDRSTSTSGSPERVAQVRTHRTAPLDQSVADPSSLPASRPRDRVNQRTPCASTGEFFNTIGAKRTFMRKQDDRAASSQMISYGSNSLPTRQRGGWVAPVHRGISLGWGLYDPGPR